MTLLALGVNHQTCPLAVRERLAFARDDVAPALADLTGVRGAGGAAIVSTCNRTELLVNADGGRRDALVAWLAARGGLTPARLEDYLYEHRDRDAVRHLFRVASGLDSMIVGEAQVLGQVKDAYHLARDAGTLDAPLERLFQNTFAVAKRVRSETRIGANPVSVAFAAVRLAERVFADLARSNVLLIGAGDTVELVARHLSEVGAKRISVANRTLANAEAVARPLGARALALDELQAVLADADLVIASTASREPLLTRTMIERAVATRRHRPMLLIDLGVPRDIEPAVATVADVFLYSVDDLARVIEENLRSRREAAREAEAIIDLGVDHFLGWLGALDDHALIGEVHANAFATRDALLARAREELDAGKDANAVLARFANALTARLLHAPSANLRDAARRGDSALVDAASRLFARPRNARSHERDGPAA